MSGILKHSVEGLLTKEPRKINFTRLNLGFVNAHFSPFGTWQAKGKTDATNGKNHWANTVVWSVKTNPLTILSNFLPK